MTYKFFAGYRLKTVTEPDGRTVTHTYDNNDNLLTQTVSNGVSYRYTYDVRNRATGLTATLDGRNFGFGYATTNDEVRKFTFFAFNLKLNAVNSFDNSVIDCHFSSRYNEYIGGVICSIIKKYHHLFHLNVEQSV